MRAHRKHRYGHLIRILLISSLCLLIFRGCDCGKAVKSEQPTDQPTGASLGLSLIGLTEPYEVSIAPGDSLSIEVLLTRISGMASGGTVMPCCPSVDLSMEDPIPPGITYTFQPSPVESPADQSTLTIRIAPDISYAIHMLTIVGWSAQVQLRLTIPAATSRWPTRDAETGRSLYAVDFSVGGKGTIVGAYRTILHTADGGMTWSPATVEAMYSPKRVHGVDLNFLDGMAVGEEGSGFRTSDGGATWEEIEAHSGNPSTLYDVSVTSEFAVAVGHGASVPSYYEAIVRTEDHGEHWDDVSGDLLKPFFGVCFPSSLVGYAVGEGIIAKSTDGGRSWRGVLGLSDKLFDVFFIDVDTGWAVGEEGVIYHTTDGGEDWNSWNRQDSGASAYDLYGVSFVNRDVGVIVGGEGSDPGEHILLWTTDGGEHWSVESEGGPKLQDVFMFDENSAIAVGFAGTILYRE